MGIKDKAWIMSLPHKDISYKIIELEAEMKHRESVMSDKANENFYYNNDYLSSNTANIDLFNAPVDLLSNYQVYWLKTLLEQLLEESTGE